MQKMRIRDTDIEFRIQDKVFPFIENGMMYLRVVILNDDGEPTDFISVMPQDILYRTQTYNDEMMAEIDDAANKAMEDFANRMAAQKEQEEKEETVEPGNDNGGMHYG